MIARKLAYWSAYSIVRWQLLVGITACWLAWTWIKSNYRDPDTVHWLVLEAVIPIVGWTLLTIAVLSVLSALVAWIVFVFQMRRKRVNAKLRFGEGQSADAGYVPVTLQMTGVFRPILGTISASIVFRNMKLSDTIILDEDIRDRNKWFRNAIAGRGYADLHDRGLHDVEEIQVLFSDALRLIVLPYTIETNRRLYTVPPPLDPIQIYAEPNRTEEQTQRIQTPKRVEGEYINYKNFESGDDVRRVVWKIYARNGELVVRIPETMDPYASHLVFYASFYNGYIKDIDVLTTELLNSYKDEMRNLLEAVQANGYEVRLPPDQPPVKEVLDEEKDQLLFQISTSAWQHDLPPTEYIQNKDAALVCISSLVPVAEVERLLNQLPAHIPVLAIQLSGAIPTVFQLPLKEIFFRIDRQPADKLRNRWTVSSLRRELIQNEYALQQLFTRRGNSQLMEVKSR